MFPAISNTNQHNSGVLKAASILLFALLLYTIQDSFIKSLPPEQNVIEIVFFRSLFAFIPIGIVVLLKKYQADTPLKTFKTKYIKGHLLRAFFMFLSLVCYFYGCRKIPLATLYTLSYTAPLFMTCLSIPLLNEKVGIRRTTAIIIGFIGVMIVLQPGTDAFRIEGLAVVLSGLFTGIAVVLGKRLSLHDSTTLIVTMYSGMALVLSGIALPFVWITPDTTTLMVLLITGICGGCAQYGFTKAFTMTDVSSLAPFDYCALLFAILFGYIFWSEVPSKYTLLGAILIISMGVFTIYREKKLHS